MSAEAQMRLLGEHDGVRWYWAAPGMFHLPGVYYWDGGDNVRVEKAQPAPSPQPTRHLTVTTTESGEAVMVSWQDDDHRILEVVWERKDSALQLAAPVDEREAVNMAKARAVFESISKCSHNHQRSARGTYRNPLVARDWKWFQLGIYHATEGDK